MYSKVLFTASSFAHIRSFHEPYLRAFHAAGAEVHVACGGEPCTIDGITRVISLPFKKKLTSILNFRAEHILHQLMKDEKYDLIITHTSLAAFFTRLAVRHLIPAPKVIYMCHGYLFDDHSSRLRRMILLSAERFVSGQTDLLLNMNDYDYQLARKYGLGKNIKRIPGVGVDYDRLDASHRTSSDALRRMYGIPESAFVLFYAAEFSPRKNQAFLIRAMRKLPDNVFLVLAGQGDLLDSCKALSTELQVDNRIVFPGHVSPVANWYLMADAAVSSSRSEGLPFNIMEAMHFCLPVIASDVKGNQDLITNGKNGLLYPFGCETTYLKAVTALISSPSMRKEMSQEASISSGAYDLKAAFQIVWGYYSLFLPA